MERVLKLFLSKEDMYKIRLIKKYARIRFKRFWKEWGFSKEDCMILLTGVTMFAIFWALFVVGCML